MAVQVAMVVQVVGQATVGLQRTAHQALMVLLAMVAMVAMVVMVATVSIAPMLVCLVFLVVMVVMVRAMVLGGLAAPEFLQEHRALTVEQAMAVTAALRRHPIPVSRRLVVRVATAVMAGDLPMAAEAGPGV